LRKKIASATGGEEEAGPLLRKQIASATGGEAGTTLLLIHVMIIVPERKVV